MATYAYLAYTRDGKKRKGVLIADNSTSARDMLEGQGLFPETLTETSESGEAGRTRSGAVRFRRQLRPEELSLFTRQMAMCLDARLSIDDALKVLMGNDGAPTVARLAAELSDGLRDGLSLSSALRRTTFGLPEDVQAAIQAGESSGELAQVMASLAEYIETRRKTASSAMTALVYPAFVGLVSLGVAGFLLVNVTPELAQLFAETGQPLPGVTKASLALGDFFARRWWALLLVMAGVVVGYAAAMRVPAVRAVRDRLVLALPVIGSMTRQGAGAMYLRTLALVLGANIPAVQAMRFAGAVLTNTVLRAEADAAYLKVEQGQRMGTALKGVSAVPALALQLIVTGESSGRVAPMTERAATILEDSVAMRSKRLSSVLEPIVMMGVGGLVLLVVLSVMLPIFDLQTQF